MRKIVRICNPEVYLVKTSLVQLGHQPERIAVSVQQFD